MSCRGVARLLSPLRDGQLAGPRRAAVLSHLEACAACNGRWRALSEALDLLAASPRIEPPEPLAPRVAAQLEIERRGGLPGVVFGSLSGARPLLAPSLLAAAALVLSFIGGVVALDAGSEPLPEVYVRPGSPAWAALVAPLGSERNPLAPSSSVQAPKLRDSRGLPAELLADLQEETFFLETVVARDGSVSGVRLIEGDAASAAALVDALRRERFEPARYQGRPVAVSMYRLISRMEVRAPLT